MYSSLCHIFFYLLVYNLDNYKNHLNINNSRNHPYNLKRYIVLFNHTAGIRQRSTCGSGSTYNKNVQMAW